MTTSASNWEQADKAYQLHHINCPQCIAAGAAPGKRTGTPTTPRAIPRTSPGCQRQHRRAPILDFDQPAQQAGFFTIEPS